MKRLRRLLFNFAAGVSLMLCVASIAAWGFSRENPIFFSAADVRFSPQYGRRWVHWETPYEPAPASSRSHFLARHRFAWIEFVRTQTVVTDSFESIMAFLKLIARWTFFGASAISLLVCIATVALWTRSYSVADYMTHGTRRGPAGINHYLLSKNGTLSYWQDSFRALFPTPRPIPPEWQYKAVNEPTEFARTEFLVGGPTFLGIGYETIHSSNSLFVGTRRSAKMPIWVVTMLSILMPGIWGLRWARRRQLSQTGHCPTCGYDLRATPERCPECGTVAREAQ